MNVFDSKVFFVNIIRAHGLETKETLTGPTVVVGAAIITYHNIRYVLLHTAVLSVFGWCH